MESYTTQTTHYTPEQNPEAFENFELVQDNLILSKVADRFHDLIDSVKGRGLKFAATGALMGAATLTLAGCGGNASAEAGPKPTHTASQEATPTATPTPTETETTPAVNYESGLSAADIAKYQAMTPADFSASPKAEQLAYMLSVVGGTANIQEFADDYYRVTQDPADQLTIPQDAENASQQVVTAELNYATRIPLMLDGDNRTKATIALLWQGMDSSTWVQANEADTSDPLDMTGGAVAVDKIAPGNAISSMSPTHLDAAGEKVRDIVAVSADGTTYNSQIHYVEIPIAGGGTLGWWD